MDGAQVSEAIPPSMAEWIEEKHLMEIYLQMKDFVTRKFLLE